MTRAIPDLCRLRGFVPAVPTPFRDGRIDEDAFAIFTWAWRPASVDRFAAR